MSDFAFFRFKSTNMLTLDEERHKQEIVELTEQVLDAKGIECDSKISKISEELLREILEEVRKLRKKRKKKTSSATENENEEEKGGAGEEQVRQENLMEPQYVR